MEGFCPHIPMGNSAHVDLRRRKGLLQMPSLAAVLSGAVRFGRGNKLCLE